eukprot:CAMPEP_0172564836 /NCGR_PEP_ID=MMETSP1067-20121228/105855_1 /TAXON_ID=265564 ORGANISM="Thalassiosira punctigera, Strain Tpunct2005C2" /NCGR_SAMPLE_ID=MMETSP1067 /ASSEMBLY_ACC=CAM_ASM_000444 /LENGTH=618 /DNA_ID=CAMNT_0013355609 /DNA_START=453 /DNA_END=2309 /DNA_ORIENTATION=+
MTKVSLHRESPANICVERTISFGENNEQHDPLLNSLRLEQYRDLVNDLPTVFAYPHCYEPHPIAKLAADELRVQLSNSAEFQANIVNDEEAVGKMMGVLVVQHSQRGVKNDDRKQQQQHQQQLGYLKAYSGTLPVAMEICSEEYGFCPPVYNRFGKDGFYKRGEAKLNELTRSIERIENDPKRRRRRDHLNAMEESWEQKWSSAKANAKAKQKERRSLRKQQKSMLDEAEYEALDERLKQEGAEIQRSLKRLKLQNEIELEKAQIAVHETERGLQRLKDVRRAKSRELQDRLFDRYVFLSASGEERSLLPMFDETPLRRPPSGAGDCAAPKLFQYAFSRGYVPVAIAEFWWGNSPSNEVRRHDLYYPACRGKCQPILEHMLKGMEVESNPNDAVPAAAKEGLDGAFCVLEVLYEDQWLVAVNKPEGVLSTPGRALEHSVYSLARERYPEATGPLLVHRLDMSTSGVLLLAKDKDVHKALSRQFIERSVKKRYVALLNGELGKNKKKKGRIDLPLAPDYINRPMQMVSEDEGKPAQTVYEVVEVVDGVTRVNFYPVTGRTHQLRVHAAHPRGLDLPIVGDDIYGARDTDRGRLCLHAGFLEVTHPVTGERKTFTVPAPF